MTPADDLAAAEQAYRQARWKLIVLAIFLVICTIASLWVRRLFKGPPLLIGVPFAVALIVFGGDIMRFIRCRDRLRELQSKN